MNKLRTAFIGVGGIAQARLRALQEVDNVEVAAVCDIIPERAEQTAARWGIDRWYVDYHEMIAKEDIEAVSVCTYNQAHAQPTIDALEAGLHVLCEKPMAATLEDATAIARAGAKSDKVLHIALKDRYDPRLLMAKSLMDAGTLGDIYYAETVSARRKGNPGKTFINKETAGIGATADIGVYCLYHALFLMGWPKPVSVSGIANNLLSKRSEQLLYTPWTRWEPDEVSVEDFGVAWVRFENGAVLVFKTCWLMHMDSLGGTFFLGTDAGLRLEPLTVFRQEAGVLTDSVVQAVPPFKGSNLFRDEYIAFAEAVLGGKPSPVPAADMLITNVIIQGLFDSASAGGQEIAVSVPEL